MVTIRLQLATSTSSRTDSFTIRLRDSSHSFSVSQEAIPLEYSFAWNEQSGATSISTSIGSDGGTITKTLYSYKTGNVGVGVTTSFYTSSSVTCRFWSGDSSNNWTLIGSQAVRNQSVVDLD